MLMFMSAITEQHYQIPYNATDIETAILPASVYVQYDAIRLEVK